jgi:cytochrome c553
VFTLAAGLPTPAATAQEVASAAAAEKTGEQAKIERGGYLVAIMDCNACHTPWKMGENGPEQDMTRMLSGHPQDLQMPPAPELPAGPWDTVSSATVTAWSGPWGVSFTRNLTPDADTGLGAWTEREFIDTLRNGRKQGIGRELLPPMPWPAYGQASDEDLSAVFAYLRSIPAISNRVPDPIPPAPAH